MNVIRPGHRYGLTNFENKELYQELQFIEKEADPHGGDQLITVNDGTTNEEVLACLIDRMQSLQAKFPCRENAIVTTILTNTGQMESVTIQAWTEPIDWPTILK